MWFFGRKEYKAPRDDMPSKVPWLYMPNEQVVRHVTGYMQRTLVYRGHDLSAKSPHDLHAIINRINRAVMRLGAGWALHAECQRKPIQPVDAIEIDNDFAAMVESIRRENLNDQGRLYTTTYYLTLTCVPQKRVTSVLFERFTQLFGGLFKGGVDVESQQDEDARQLKVFMEKTDRFFTQIKSAFPYIEFLSGDALLTYLHSTISQYDQQVSVPNPAFGLNYILADTPVETGDEMMLGSKHVRILSVSNYPSVTRPSLMEKFDHLGVSYRMVTRFMQLGNKEAIDLIETHKKYALDQVKKGRGKSRFMHAPEIDTQMVSHADAMRALIKRVKADKITMGFHQTSIVLADEDPAALNKAVKRVRGLLEELGFLAIDEQSNISSAWLGAMPGNVYSNPRRPLMTSRHFAHTMSIQASWEGEPVNTHFNQPAHIVAITNNCVPFYANLNVKKVGHTMILGTTGGGKSMALCALVTLFLKYHGARVFLFDKDRSSRATILAAGGQFVDMAVGRKTMAFQPLKDIDRFEDMEFITAWLEEVFVTQGIEMHIGRKQKLYEALKTVSQFPVKQRTMSVLKFQIQDRAMSAGLGEFCRGGLYGSVWDNDVEALSLSDVIAFEMGKLMNSAPKLISMTLRYLFHRIEQRVKSQHVEGQVTPSLFVLDEAWLFFQNPMFEKRIAEWLVTMRKFDVYVVFASQQIQHVTKSAIAPTLLDSCLTRILLPTHLATTNEFKPAYKALGLNDTQIAHLAEVADQQNEHHWRYYFTNPLGDRFFDFQFSEVEKAFFGASSPRDQVAIDRAIEDARAHNLPFGQVFLHQKGFVQYATQWGQF